MTAHEIIYYFLVLVAVRLGWKLKEWRYEKEQKAKELVESMEEL